jgi:hypothetical protein
MMYHIDLEGKMFFEKINFNEERIDFIQNPLLGPLMRRKHVLLNNPEMNKRAN